MKKIKDFLRNTPARAVWLKYHNFKQMQAWRKNPNTPPPHPVKEKSILDLARTYGTKILVETGTYQGDMVQAMRKHFNQIYSIELDKALAERAQKRFSGIGKIQILQGDSAQVLPQVLAKIHEPALFWLDGHFSGGQTAKGDLDTPIVAELNSIFSAHLPSFVIIIDDARCFVGQNDYPTLESLRSLIAAQTPKLDMEVINDAIRITPAKI